LPDPDQGRHGQTPPAGVFQKGASSWGIAIRPRAGQSTDMSYKVTLAGETLIARPSGALFWPARGVLCVADLHLGKSERMARRAGTLLPPYETRDTLRRLEAEIAATGAGGVICLGDSFDDVASLDGLEGEDREGLIRLVTGRDWLWIAGNHDAGPLNIVGRHQAEAQIGPLWFRHIAEPQKTFEISGHFHPKLRLAGTAWPCFLADAARVILPAFGTYTGGLWTHDPALCRIMAPEAIAVLCGGASARAIPMPRKNARQR